MNKQYTCLLKKNNYFKFQKKFNCYQVRIRQYHGKLMQSKVNTMYNF